MKPDQTWWLLNCQCDDSCKGKLAKIRQRTYANVYSIQKISYSLLHSAQFEQNHVSTYLTVGHFERDVVLPGTPFTQADSPEEEWDLYLRDWRAPGKFNLSSKDGASSNLSPVATPILLLLKRNEIVRVQWYTIYPHYPQEGGQGNLWSWNPFTRVPNPRVRVSNQVGHRIEWAPPIHTSTSDTCHFTCLQLGVVRAGFT